MAAAKTQPARGMRDFLPSDVRRREYVISVIKEVYERYGFEPLETPAVENIETLMGKYGEEGNRLIFKILKRGEHERTGEADLALRYDLTVPLARVVAEYRDKLPKFFKRYQIQPVWRADRPARGRFREFYQCDVDILGSRSMVVEAELCAAASEALEGLGFNDFTIFLNHRKVLTGILNAANVPLEKHTDALIALDKLDKIGNEGVKAELTARGINEQASEYLIYISNWDEAALEMFGASMTSDIWNSRVLGFLQGEVLNKGLNKNIGEASLERGTEEIARILEITSSNAAKNRIKLNPHLARGLSYYTGAIMEINVPDLAGSLGGGGRYDNLVGMFSGQDVPACGFSLGLERIIVVMTEREMFPKNLTEAPAEIMVTIWNEATVAESVKLASELRGEGLKVDLYTDADKIGKQFKYASARGIPFVAVLGDEERERGDVALKDMRTGEQMIMPREHVGATVREKLSEA
ncbi:MAG TPA: histidine--tRNA ligase [Pyrinomonadaceae bacterium]|nr:histidine--tRNA ligase [Pyrinomonadaceae bacterium]